MKSLFVVYALGIQGHVTNCVLERSAPRNKEEVEELQQLLRDKQKHWIHPDYVTLLDWKQLED